MNPFTTEPNLRLLIVDDNQAIHEDFRKVIGCKTETHAELTDVEAELFGDAATDDSDATPCFQLDSAYQGEEGLALVQRALDEGRPYALAFIDVRMPPGWDGIETSAKILETDPDLQIVICTAYSDYSWDEMLRKLGASDRLVILKKPFDKIEVTQLARNLTRKWQLLQELKKKMAAPSHHPPKA
jgi:CheY-like chemotaxis protein